jgi:hypothetical protein
VNEILEAVAYVWHTEAGRFFLILGATIGLTTGLTEFLVRRWRQR